MRAEKVILSFISVLLGLLVAGGAFYLYQSTKVIPQQKLKSVTAKISPTTPPSSPFTVDEPTDEKVVGSKTITVSGKTSSDATIIVVTPTDQQIATPASNGTFSLTTTIDDGENQVEISSVTPNGQTTKLSRTVTFTTESF